MKLPILPSGMVFAQSTRVLARRMPPLPGRPKQVRRKRGKYKKPRMLKDRVSTRTRPPTPSGLLSIVPRMPRWQMDAIKQLAKETRVHQSHYLREAIEDVLRKHGAL